jgi:hypothetical protein
MWSASLALLTWSAGSRPQRLTVLSHELNHYDLLVLCSVQLAPSTIPVLSLVERARGRYGSITSGGVLARCSPVDHGQVLPQSR